MVVTMREDKPCADRHSDSLILDGDVRIELLGGPESFMGLGRVQVGPAILRNAQTPMFVEIRTPDAQELVRYRLARSRPADRGWTLEFTADVRQGGWMEWMLHTVRNRYRVAGAEAEPQSAQDTTLTLTLRPARRTIGQTEFVGFSYQYQYSSRSLPVYRILDRASWEPTGQAVGNELWMRNSFTASVAAIRSVEQLYSTEWYLPNCANPNVFQFAPFQTEFQGFTMTAGTEGTLLTWSPQVAHIRTLLEKPRGADFLLHLHEHCGDLANDFATAPMEVLWAPGRRDRVELFNLYEAVKEFVHGHLHRQAGLRRERISTYGMIEEWGPADLDRYRAVGLPRLLEAGMKKIGLANHFQNNMNVYGVNNMCCTLDLKVADSVGPDKLAAFCRDARAGGAKVEMWGNTAISNLLRILAVRNAPTDRIRFLPEKDSILEVIARSKAPFVHNASGAVEADHYSPAFAVMNLRDPDIRDYWMKRWREAHDHIGLEGIFLDSSFNLSSDKFHWVANTAPASLKGATADQTHLLGFQRPAVEPPAAILSQYPAHLSLMAQMQQAGYDYCNEDIGVFGLHRHGPAVTARLNCLPIWTDCIAWFDTPALQRAGADLRDVFFKGLAYRMMWGLAWDPKKDRLSLNQGGLRGEFDAPADWQMDLWRAFNTAEPFMLERTILPEERGVLYRSDKGLALWAFADFDHPLDAPRAIRDLLADTTQTAATLHARKHRVYVIG